MSNKKEKHRLFKSNWAFAYFLLIASLPFIVLIYYIIKALAFVRIAFF